VAPAADLGHTTGVAEESLDAASFPPRTRTLWLTLCAVSPRTAAHSQRVIDLSGRLADALELSDEERSELAVAARFHDVGECFLAPGLAGKPIAFSLEERHAMQRHADLGANALLRVGTPRPVADVVRAHHERWDGTGYPRRLAGEEIPPNARLLHVCEAWDAMRKNRLYAEALSKDEALAELRQGAGTQFDPRIAGVAAEVFSAAPEG
jgi:HD-GYP domain-containing protein (c-di-GMP phosphodiesterase class II)